MFIISHYYIIMIVFQMILYG